MVESYLREETTNMFFLVFFPYIYLIKHEGLNSFHLIIKKKTLVNFTITHINRIYLYARYSKYSTGFLKKTWAVCCNQWYSGLGLRCLTPLLIIFQSYRGGQLYWWRKPEYLEITNTIQLSPKSDDLFDQTV